MNASVICNIPYKANEFFSAFDNRKIPLSEFSLSYLEIPCGIRLVFKIHTASGTFVDGIYILYGQMYKNDLLLMRSNSRIYEIMKLYISNV